MRLKFDINSFSSEFEITLIRFSMEMCFLYIVVDFFICVVVLIHVVFWVPSIFSKHGSLILS